MAIFALAVLREAEVAVISPRVSSLTSGVLVIAAGDSHTCALVNGGVQ